MPPAPPRPGWSPPPYVAPPPRPRRQGLVLFWPTLALVAIALGLLGLYEYAGNTVVDAAYPALALTVTGVMLVVGAFVGRPGGLILIGIVSAIAMGIASATGGFEDAKRLNYSPASSSDVRTALHVPERRAVARPLPDLRPRGPGRTIRVKGGAGRIEVILPRTVIVDVDADIRSSAATASATATEAASSSPRPSPSAGPPVTRPSTWTSTCGSARSM